MSIWQDNLRVVDAPAPALGAEVEAGPTRSEPQQALVETYEKARAHAIASMEQAAESLAWTTNIEPDIPAEYRAIPQLIGRYENWLKDRQRVRQ